MKQERNRNETGNRNQEKVKRKKRTQISSASAATQGKTQSRQPFANCASSPTNVRRACFCGRRRRRLAVPPTQSPTIRREFPAISAARRRTACGWCLPPTPGRAIRTNCPTSWRRHLQWKSLGQYEEDSNRRTERWRKHSQICACSSLYVMQFRNTNRMSRANFTLLPL